MLDWMAGEGAEADPDGPGKAPAEWERTRM